MAWLTPLNAYIGANILMVLAAALLEVMRAVSARLARPIAYRDQRRLGEAMMLAAVLLPLVGSSSGGGGFMSRAAQVWSAPNMYAAAVAAREDHRLAVSFASAEASVPLDAASQAVAVLFVAGLLLCLVRLAIDGAATLRIIADAQAIRRHGAVRVLASERIGVPFAFWLPKRYFIVVPSALVLSSDDLRIAIRHEAQHHRQLDTKLLYLHHLLRAAFFWNPAVHRLEGQLRELQEFACDEALGARRNASAHDYCGCLLRVAEAAIGRDYGRVQASMISGGAGQILKRRIEAMLRRPSGYLRPSVVFFAGAAALTLMATTAGAFSSTIHDRRITAEQAHRMAAIAQHDSALPIAVNDRVLKQLNLLLSTPDGRAYLQASLRRMRRYQAFISDQLERHGMPLDLLSVPLAESGYRNLPQGANPRHGAGLWMFVADTARHFGLEVDASRDERLDVAAETGAAIRMLSSLHRHFDDWGLALLAYNAGSALVERAIEQTGSRDVWELTAKHYENDPDYVPRVVAMMLILRNPTVLD